MARRGTRVRSTLVLLGAVWLVTACTAPRTSGEVPDLAAPSLETGRLVALESLQPRVVLVNVWATWCEPCRREMPFLAELQDEHAELAVVGINVDQGIGRARLLALVEGLGADFLHLLDPGNTFRQELRTTGVPESVLLGDRGQVLHRWKGPIDSDPSRTRNIVRAALRGDPAGEVGALGRVPSVGSGTALAAGLVSFFSPCVLPVVPAYLAVLAGEGAVGGAGLRKRSRARALANGSLFVAGFSAVFVLLGVSAGWLGSGFGSAEWPARVGGVLVLVMGLHLARVLRIPRLERTAGLSRRLSGAGMPAGAFLVGCVFAAGWTPCIGPILAGILSLAALTGSRSEAALLLATYSAGMAVPFLMAAAAVGWFVRLTARVRPWLPRIERISGLALAAMGTLMATGSLSRLAGWIGGSPA